MKTVFISLVLFVGLSASAALETLKMQDGRYLSYESGIVNLNKPVFVFLPGINRGLDDRDAFIQLAKEKKLNFVSMHFSLHPESILQLPAGETPYFKGHQMTKSDLADEVIFVIAALGIKKPVITSLSYSSMVANELYKSGEFSTVVHVAPMIKNSEADGDGASYIAYWKNIFSLNPFNGAQLQQAFLKSTYLQYWLNTATQMSSVDERMQAADKKYLVADAYSELSLIAEDFDLTKDIVPVVKNQLVFILGENEEPVRAAFQVEAIDLFASKNKKSVKKITIKNAGHIIPSDAPEDYLKALQAL